MNEKDEILAVKELGEKIGYGNMMSLASSLWAISLEDKHGITTGNFIPTIISEIKEKNQKQYEIELTLNKGHIRQQLDSIKE